MALFYFLLDDRLTFLLCVFLNKKYTPLKKYRITSNELMSAHVLFLDPSFIEYIQAEYANTNDSSIIIKLLILFSFLLNQLVAPAANKKKQAVINKV